MLQLFLITRKREAGEAQTQAAPDSPAVAASPPRDAPADAGAAAERVDLRRRLLLAQATAQELEQAVEELRAQHASAEEALKRDLATLRKRVEEEKRKRATAEQKALTAKEKLEEAGKLQEIERLASNLGTSSSASAQAIDLAGQKIMDLAQTHLRSGSGAEDVIRMLCRTQAKRNAESAAALAQYDKVVSSVSDEARSAREEARVAQAAAAKALKRAEAAEAVLARAQAQAGAGGPSAPPPVAAATQPRVVLPPPAAAPAAPALTIVHAGALGGGISGGRSFIPPGVAPGCGGNDGGKFIRTGADGRGGLSKAFLPQPRQAAPPPPQAKPPAKKVKVAGGLENYGFGMR